MYLNRGTGYDWFTEKNWMLGLSTVFTLNIKLFQVCDSFLLQLGVSEILNVWIVELVDYYLYHIISSST
jgi:hypothetical protein